MCVCVCVCVCDNPLYIFVFAVYLLVSYSVLRPEYGHVWLLTTLFTEIAACKFLHDWRSYGLKPVLFCPLYVFIHFFCSFL